MIDGPCAVSTQSPQTSAQWPLRESRTPRAHERRRPPFDRGNLSAADEPCAQLRHQRAWIGRQVISQTDRSTVSTQLVQQLRPVIVPRVLWRPWERRRRRAPHPAWVGAKLGAATPHPPAADRPRCREARSAMRPPQQQPRGHASSARAPRSSASFPSGGSKRPAPPILLPVPRCSKEWQPRRLFRISSFRHFVTSWPVIE